MASKKILNSIVVLRILTLLVLAASIVVMVLNNFTIDGNKTSFTDLIAYRYVVAVAAIGFLYTLVQIPFAMYHAYKEKRLIRKGFLPEFDFYADKIISFLLATGVGVGFGVTFEIKRFFNLFFSIAEAVGATGIEEERSKSLDFLNKGIISAGILLGGFTCMALISILTSINRPS